MKLSKYVKLREEKFGAVLFEVRDEKVFTLNPTGAAVAKAISEGGDEQEIVERLAREYHDPDSTIAAEVSGFIRDLRQRGLVED